MRATGNALARIPVRHVAAVAASARSHLLALATDDGRVIVDHSARAPRGLGRPRL